LAEELLAVAAAEPDLCGGGKLRLDKGGTFTATLRWESHSDGRRPWCGRDRPAGNATDLRIHQATAL